MNTRTGDQQSGCADSTESATQLDALVDLVVERLSVARDVAAAKYGGGGPIDDPIREQQLLHSAGCALNVSALNHRMGMQFFQDQIEANKVIQRGLHHRWHRHPEEIPAAKPDLAAEVRPKLDRITAQIIQQFRCMDEAPCFKPGDIADLIDKRYSADMPDRQLPGLHRHAAAFAMRSLSATEC
jgi:chorismate mutase